MEKLKQEDFNMKIVEDMQEKRNKKRIAKFKCNKCEMVFIADVASAKHRGQKVCKSCLAIPTIFNSDHKALAQRLFSHTRFNARKRDMALPTWRNHVELQEWLENQPNFETMFKQWEESGFDKELTPSIDRLDNNRSYELDNIQLVMWEENNRRGAQLKKETLSKGIVSVYFSEGEYIDTYMSISEAEKDLGISNLNKTLRGERQSAEKCYAVYADTMPSTFEKIREWGSTRGLYQDGDPATQMLKLIEEVAELGGSIMKQDQHEIINALGDCCVVLTNLGAMYGINIEECIQECQEEIGLRQGRMINGTFVKGSSIDKYKEIDYANR